ncbi:MAG: DUF2283 domain-containing protein, partial [Cellulomonadaceae bacterium]|nr:DUF2283 domain-containing protein [Cellulomonadaceae bacterium]
AEPELFIDSRLANKLRDCYSQNMSEIDSFLIDLSDKIYEGVRKWKRETSRRHRRSLVGQWIPDDLNIGNELNDLQYASMSVTQLLERAISDIVYDYQIDSLHLVESFLLDIEHESTARVRLMNSDMIQQNIRMDVDGETDTAYLELKAELESGIASVQILIDDDRLSGEVVLGLDDKGGLLGIEFIGFKSLLRGNLENPQYMRALKNMEA